MRTTFPDLGRQFSAWRIGHEAYYAAGQHQQSKFALQIWSAFEEKQPIRKILSFILERYKENEAEVLDVLGETLIDKIKSVLQ